MSQIVATGWDFAAVKDDGSVAQWGSGDGAYPTPPVSARLSSGVMRIVATPADCHCAFAALKDNGSVVSWGQGPTGRILDEKNGVVPGVSSGECEIVATDYAFAAIKTDGSVVTWGSACSGACNHAVLMQLSSSVVHVVFLRTSLAFVSLK